MTARFYYATGFVVCVLLLGYALYTQIYMGLTPCPLCVFQRIGFIVIGIAFLLAFAHRPTNKWRWAYFSLAALGALWGIIAASRQLWLQHLPADLVPSCGPGLGYLFDAFGWTRGLALVFSGSGECAAVGWRFLGLSMAGWTSIFFVLLSVWAWKGARAGRR